MEISNEVTQEIQELARKGRRLQACLCLRRAGLSVEEAKEWLSLHYPPAQIHFTVRVKDVPIGHSYTVVFPDPYEPDGYDHLPITVLEDGGEFYAGFAHTNGLHGPLLTALRENMPRTLLVLNEDVDLPRSRSKVRLV